MRDILLSTLAACAVAFLFTWLIINWLLGCGEAFPTITGGYVYGECWLHPWEAPK